MSLLTVIFALRFIYFYLPTTYLVGHKYLILIYENCLSLARRQELLYFDNLKRGLMAPLPPLEIGADIGKGQLISECLFEKIVWTKIPTKNLIDSAQQV